MNNLKEQFLLDPDVVFLNHGSFGATPRPVFESYQAWQRLLEKQPVKFISTTRDLPGYFETARQGLADSLGADRDDLVYVPNPTFAANVVAQSLKLEPGDEVLTTDHEYGACLNAWRYYAGKQGATVVEQDLPWPVVSAEQIVEQFWQGVTPRTKVIFVSHITSATALTIPVEAITKRAREAGILMVIDGAHAPSQIDLNLDEIGADFYIGNNHKWLCAPKGSAFLHVRRDRQPLIEPLVVGWGYGKYANIDFGTQFLNYTQFLGTNDFSAYLATPDAIKFQQQHNWASDVREQCRALTADFVERVTEITDMPQTYPTDQGLFSQLGLAYIPQRIDLNELKVRLYDEHRVESPTISWKEHQFVRLSVQGYNEASDVEALYEGLSAILNG